MKKTIATVVTAGLLVVGGAGAAYAADDRRGRTGRTRRRRPRAGPGRIRCSARGSAGRW